MFRNMLKRITSVALAFALIGAGSTIEKTNNPQEAVLHTAHAISRAQCKNHGQYTITKWNSALSWEAERKALGGWSTIYNHDVYDVYCASCGNFITSYGVDSVHSKWWWD